MEGVARERVVKWSNRGQLPVEKELHYFQLLL